MILSIRAVVVVAIASGPVLAFRQAIDLPTSKQIVRPVPGGPQRLNSLPMSMAVSPDGRYVVTVNAGYGTFESKYMQSLAVMDTTTGTVADFPDPDTLGRAKQTLYSGLAFSGDGKRRPWRQRLKFVKNAKCARLVRPLSVKGSRP